MSFSSSKEDNNNDDESDDRIHSGSKFNYRINDNDH